MSAEIETLHKPFIKFLREQGLPYIRARSDRQSTIAKGAQDFTVFSGRYALCIEFKTKGNDLDPDQIAWRDSMIAVGARVFVVRTIEHAVELVQAWRSSAEDHCVEVGDKPLVRHLNAWYRETPNGLVKVRNA